MMMILLSFLRNRRFLIHKRREDICLKNRRCPKPDREVDSLFKLYDWVLFVFRELFRQLRILFRSNLIVDYGGLFMRVLSNETKIAHIKRNHFSLQGFVFKFLLRHFSKKWVENRGILKRKRS